MKRRAFLSLLGVSPIAARSAATKAAADLAGVSIAGMSGFDGGVEPHSNADATPAQARVALKIPHVLAEVRSALYEDYRRIHRIDPDIAVHRSFSLNAMITFQRQRNVERAIEQMQHDFYPYRRIQEAILRAVGVSL